MEPLGQTWQYGRNAVQALFLMIGIVVRVRYTCPVFLMKVPRYPFVTPCELVHAVAGTLASGRDWNCNAFFPGSCVLVFQNSERKHRTAVFVLVVTEELPEWEDSKTMGRKRKWFTVEDALEQLSMHKPVQLSYLQSLLTCRNDKKTKHKSFVSKSSSKRKERRQPFIAEYFIWINYSFSIMPNGIFSVNATHLAIDLQRLCNKAHLTMMLLLMLEI
ncbi:Diphosphoinositol polyphosphate phosphohydrolase 1 [Gryllus bimaculatus]|nr:Diphosphoinositol polyphosphate phosphohydrolase 1 [Gryllus bimaculatus]